LYFSVFISAFLAATILPAQSEAVLAYQLSVSPDAMVGLVAVATIGNVLGAAVNWGLGRGFTRYRDRAWFPVRAHRLETAERHYRRFGRYSLLLSWVPFIGDPITVVAGLLREPLWSFVLLVSIAKSSRYIAIAMVVANVT
jgi:membrane protein YqaA with SNARE-associated domain